MTKHKNYDIIVYYNFGDIMDNKENNNITNDINHVDDEILDLNIDPVTELYDQNATEDALQQYFKNISSYKPYSHEEEIEKFRRATFRFN